MEEENVTTTREVEAEAAGATAPDLGKFKNVDALLRAYGELEAEFTRRSQRLRALEEQSKAQEAPQEAQKAAAPRMEEPEQGQKAEAGRGGEPQIPAPSIFEPAQKGVESDELYRAVMQNEGVRARVLSDYLQSLKGVPLLTSAGAPLKAPAGRAKSLQEAGSLALGCFQSN